MQSLALYFCYSRNQFQDVKDITNYLEQSQVDIMSEATACSMRDYIINAV